MDKLLTIIIPVYNQETLVIRALESVPKRDDIEVIVIDDGSTDNTWNNLLKYRKEHAIDKDIVLLYNEKNEGVGSAVNKGYDNASGKYVVLLGSDDFFTKDFEKGLKQLDGTDLIYFDLIDNNDFIWKVNKKTKSVYVGSVKFMRREFIGDTRCPLVRVEEDLYFYNELMKKKPTEKYLNKILKHYNFPRKNSLTWLKENGGKK